MEISQSMEDHQEHEKAGPPHEALFLVSPYLPLFELLAVTGVCTWLRDAVNKDVLSWLDITVKAPLNSKLSDKILMKITSKANGRLRTLALMNCSKITDDGLQRIIERNPLINKLYLPGCTGLTPEGVVRAVKTLSEHHLHSLKSLMINGIYNINKEHLETLHSCLQTNLPTTIDVEVCPKCNEVRMVFECPRRACKRRIGREMTDCRGCNFCIPRCQECGGCIDESEEIEEAVCADILCSDCWLRLPKCDFCNKPYCKQHAHHGSSSPGSSGFVCDSCFAKFIVDLHIVD